MNAKVEVQQVDAQGNHQGHQVLGPRASGVLTLLQLKTESYLISQNKISL